MTKKASPSVLEVEGQQLYLPRLAEVIRLEQVSEKEKLLELKLPNGRELGHQPGQFVEISVYDPPVLLIAHLSSFVCVFPKQVVFHHNADILHARDGSRKSGTGPTDGLRQKTVR